jgi:hypothetical protein
MMPRIGFYSAASDSMLRVSQALTGETNPTGLTTNPATSRGKRRKSSPSESFLTNHLST